MKKMIRQISKICGHYYISIPHALFETGILVRGEFLFVTFEKISQLQKYDYPSDCCRCNLQTLKDKYLYFGEILCALCLKRVLKEQIKNISSLFTMETMPKSFLVIK